MNRQQVCIFCQVINSGIVNSSKSCEMWCLVTVEVVAGNDARAARLVFIGGTISGIVTALDAGARAGGFDELDVVIVPKAGASLWVTVAPGTTAGIVLATSIIRVQTTEMARPDATSELSITFPVLALSALESNVGPEVRGQLALLRRVPTIRRAICLCPSRVLGITDVGMCITRHDHAELVSISYVDDVIHCSS